MTKELSLIVPTYNEASNIQELTERISVSLRNLDSEVIFVDDKSPDGTAEAIEFFGKIHECFRVIRRNGRGGLSSAVLGRPVRKTATQFRKKYAPIVPNVEF